jgi:Sensors of blue-light using FAD
MIITRLTYFSRNHCHRPGQSPDDGIKDIWIESVANNRRDDVTGALIHDHAWFAQVLEGSEAVVSATFERILRDRRHSGIRLVKLQPVPARRFAAWWLAVVAHTQDNADLFRHYGESERFNPELIPTDRLGDLIEALVARAAQLQERATFQEKGTWTTRSATNAA